MEYHPGKKIAIAAQETRLLVVVPKSDKEYWKDAAKRKTPMGFKGLVLVEANWIADEGELSKFIFLLAPADEISNTGTIKKDKVEKIRIGANFV